MTITEEIRIAGTAEAIAEALMKCGKVKDMAEAFRAVTGEDFCGKIVGVKKDELAYNMGWQIKNRLEVESFKALPFSKKVTELCMMDGYDTGRFLHVFTLVELRKVAEIIGADTSEVNTENELTERLDYLTAITHKLIMSPQGIKIQFPERSDPVQPENLCDDDSFSDAPGDNSCPEQDIPEPYISEESPDSVRANQREEKFLQCRSISAVKREITAMLNKYAENRALIQVIREGVTNIRKCIKVCEKQRLPTGAFEKVIKEAHEKYREIRREGFKLRLKLLRVMSASEIRLACKAFMARCEKERRRHNSNEESNGGIEGVCVAAQPHFL